MTTSQKFKYKAKGYGKQWDLTTSFMAYFTGLDTFCTSLANCSISTSIKEMTMAAGMRMWECEMFTKDQMVAWENKPAAKKMWQALQDYFTEKWLEQCQYLQATAKHLHFKDATLAAQEQAVAEQGGGNGVHTSPGTTQESDGGNGNSKPESNGRNDGADNALVAGHGKLSDKENTPPATGNASSGTTGRKRNKKKCTHCGKH